MVGGLRGAWVAIEKSGVWRDGQLSTDVQIYSCIRIIAKHRVNLKAKVSPQYFPKFREIRCFGITASLLSLSATAHILWRHCIGPLVIPVVSSMATQATLRHRACASNHCRVAHRLSQDAPRRVRRAKGGRSAACVWKRHRRRCSPEMEDQATFIPFAKKTESFR